ncbi:hypothetical protein GGD83_000314 [Rhodoblastus sphagnicola]|uniref:hypothetical protein n=1 Tax=Rhodoblastus sphagnicola TaxID=333368 RepID=UPI0011B0B1A8|nr:hypothetical protein [Rhodoblastus sphagnicola]MBB4196543.1 hypothetical protein [Rhodoblastus sphagnicola]
MRAGACPSFGRFEHQLREHELRTWRKADLSEHSLARQRMFAETSLFEQDSNPKTGGHFSEILLRPKIG